MARPVLRTTARGKQGPTGPEGERGPQGDQGPQGERGLPGVNAVPADEAIGTYLETEESESRAGARAAVAADVATPGNPIHDALTEKVGTQIATEVEPALTEVRTELAAKGRPSVASLTRPYFISHRADPLMWPEETVVGFYRTADGGADGIEADLWQTSDGDLFAIHDRSLDRTTDGTGNIDTVTTAYVEGLTVDHVPDGYPADAFRGEGVPPVDTYLRIMMQRGVVAVPQVYAASGYPSGVNAFIAAVRRTGIDRDSVLVQATDSSDVAALVAAGFKHIAAVSSGIPDYAALRAQGYTHLVQAEAVITPSEVDAAHAAGLQVVAYVANTQDRAAQLLAMGVDGIMSDDTAYVKKTYTPTPHDLFGVGHPIPGHHTISGTPGNFYGDGWYGWDAGGSGSTKATRLGYMEVAGPSCVVEFEAIINADGGAPTTNGLWLILLDRDAYVPGGAPNVAPNGYGFKVFADGGVGIHRINAGAQSTLVAKSAAPAGFALGTPYAYRITITPTSVEIRRTDGSAVAASAAAGATAHRANPYRLMLQQIGLNASSRVRNVAQVA